MISMWFWHTLLSGIAVAAGYRIARRAWHKLRRLQVSIELLVTVAIAGALLLGEFMEAAAVAALFVGGERLEARALKRTRLALSMLVDLLPEKAAVLKDGVPVEVAPEDVRAGDTLLIREGARVPADGEVLNGHAAVDESPITGESLPVEKFAGSIVFAGSVSRNGTM